MTIDETLVRVAASGLRVHNLFQCQARQGASAPLEWLWQANLTDGHQVWEYGRASSARQALELALLNAQMTKGEPLAQVRQTKINFDQGDLVTTKTAEELGL